jgi:hypothetical protein
VRVDFAANSSLAVDEKNVCGLNFGIKFNVILPAAPCVTRIVQQIVYLIFVGCHLAKFSDRLGVGSEEFLKKKLVILFVDLVKPGDNKTAKNKTSHSLP